jgi:cell shape-determining protein MreC
MAAIMLRWVLLFLVFSVVPAFAQQKTPSQVAVDIVSEVTALSRWSEQQAQLIQQLQTENESLKKQIEELKKK